MRVRIIVSVMLLCTFLGCPSAYHLGFPGEYPVAKYFTHWDPDYSEITVFYPNTEPRIKNAPPVIFSTGWNQPRGSYEGYATQLAQWGYVAIIRYCPGLGISQVGNAMLTYNANQLSGIIDWLDRENARPDSPLFEMVDTNNVGATGHSMGATISMIQGSNDPRIKAIVSLDIKYMETRLRPLLHFDNIKGAYLIVSTDDPSWCGVPRNNEGKLLPLLPSPATEVKILGADHMDFEDSLTSFNYLALAACPEGRMDSQLARDISARYMIAWFNVYLQGRSEFVDYYSGKHAQDDVDQGLVTIEQNLP